MWGKGGDALGLRGRRQGRRWSDSVGSQETSPRVGWYQASGRASFRVVPPGPVCGRIRAGRAGRGESSGRPNADSGPGSAATVCCADHVWTRWRRELPPNCRPVGAGAVRGRASGRILNDGVSDESGGGDQDEHGRRHEPAAHACAAAFRLSRRRIRRVNLAIPNSSSAARPIGSATIAIHTTMVARP